jgi:hypothetical protein
MSVSYILVGWTDFALKRIAHRSMKHLRWIALAALLVIPAFLVCSYARESLAVDSALDRGGSYDYSRGRAGLEASHAYIPFRERHATLLAVSGGSILCAVGYIVLLVMTTQRPDGD